MRSLRPSHLNLLLGVALSLAAWPFVGCGRDVGIVEISDVGFIEPADVATEDVSSGDVSAFSCSVGALDACPADRLCCATPEERCVPSADGVHHCVTSGSVGEGERCGSRGADDCEFGSLCATPSRGGESICRRICETDTDCSGGTCVVELELGGETIRLCE